MAISEFPKMIYKNEFDPFNIQTDPLRLQFKSGSGNGGVTGTLKSVTEWNESFSGQVIVWESLEGVYYIGDGHQRLERARALVYTGDGKKIRLNGFLIKESDGWTVEHARIYCALKNLAENAATTRPLDVAKIFRNGGSDALVSGFISRNNKLYLQGKALASLSDLVFGIFLNNPSIPIEYGVAVGQYFSDDHRMQETAISILRRVRPDNLDCFMLELRNTLHADLIRATQQDLFGCVLDMKDSPFYIRYEIKAEALKILGGTARVFQDVVRNADILSGLGNIIQQEFTRNASKRKADLLHLIKKQAHLMGHVSELLNAAVEIYIRSNNSRFSKAERMQEAVKFFIQRLEQTCPGSDHTQRERKEEHGGPSSGTQAPLDLLGGHAAVVTGVDQHALVF